MPSYSTGAMNLMPIPAIVLAFVAVSCTSPPPEIAVPENPVPPKSKPVSIERGAVKKGSYTGIGLEDFYPMQQSGDVLIYDVRDPYFYKIDHIPGAVNWPSKRYNEEIQKRDLEIQSARNSGTRVVLYCSNLGCPEARNVAKKLTHRGYDVCVLSMGIDSWRSAGLPLE